MTEQKVAVGFVIGFTNQEFQIDLYGSPHEVAAELRELGHDPRRAANHLDTEILWQAVRLPRPSITFNGGPDALTSLELVECVTEGSVASAVDVIRRGTVPTSFLSHLLLHAAAYSEFELVEALLEHGADPRTAGSLGMTPLHWARASGQDSSAKALLRCGAEHNALSWFLLTPDEMGSLNAVHDSEADALREQLWGRVLRRLEWLQG